MIEQYRIISGEQPFYVQEEINSLAKLGYEAAKVSMSGKNIRVFMIKSDEFEFQKKYRRQL